MGKSPSPQQKHPKAESVGSMYMVYLGYIFCETWLITWTKGNVSQYSLHGSYGELFADFCWGGVDALILWWFSPFKRWPVTNRRFWGSSCNLLRNKFGRIFYKLLILNFLKECFQHAMLIILICDCLIPPDGATKSYLLVWNNCPLAENGLAPAIAWQIYNNFMDFFPNRNFALALQLPKVSEHPACFTNQFRTSFLKENLWGCHWFSQGRSPRRIHPRDLATEVGWLAEKLMVHIEYPSFYQQFPTCEVVGLGMSEPWMIDTLQ